jgi:DNA repair protein RadC
LKRAPAIRPTKTLRRRVRPAARQANQPRALWPAVCREVKIITVREEPAPHATFDCPERIVDLWRSVIASADWYQEDKEHLVSFCLDTRNRVKSFSLVSIGTLNECIVHPREVFRPAVVDAAQSVIVVHNHPSGNPSPSRRDVAMTRRLYFAGELLLVSLLDSVIVGAGQYFSFREHPSLCWPPRDRRSSNDVTLGSCLRRANTKTSGRGNSALPVRPVIAAARKVIVHLTKKQWAAMKATANQGSVKQFLKAATRAQLLQLRDATPVRFDCNGRSQVKGKSPASLVFVRNLRRCETDDWERSKFQRQLVRQALKLKGVAA